MSGLKTESVGDLVKTLVRPLGAFFWLVIRALAICHGYDMGVSLLVVGMDAATLEYFGERAYQRIKETRNAKG